MGRKKKDKKWFCHMCNTYVKDVVEFNGTIIFGICKCPKTIGR